MPNWVDNVMIVKADKQVLTDLRSKIKVDERDEQYVQIARSLYPMPQDLKYVLGTNRDELRYVKLQDKVVFPPEDWYWEDDKIKSRKQFPDITYDVVELTEGEKKLLEEKHGATNWYDWNIANYGSKWPDCYSYAKTVQNGNLLFQFESAWAPLVVLAKRISEDNECKVVLKYSSFDNADKGEVRYNNGQIYYDRWEYWDLSELYENVKEEE